MGADLVGMILVGPRRMGKRRLNKAKREIGRIRKDHTRLHAELAKLEKPTDEEYEAKMTKLLRKPEFNRLQRLVNWSINVQGAVDGTFDAVDGIDDFLADTGEHVVDWFMEVWENHMYRTVMSRAMPGDRSKKIVVCADRTWGDPWDSYETNKAGWILSTIEWLGLFPILGIE